MERQRNIIDLSIKSSDSNEFLQLSKQSAWLGGRSRRYILNVQIVREIVRNHADAPSSLEGELCRR